jgi:SPP1 gp7 family putative phage head morphogenesis protein
MKRAIVLMKDRPEYGRTIAAQLWAYLEEVVYRPLLEMLADEEIPEDNTARFNARFGAVMQALQSRQIHYENGHFSGTFNSAISRELRIAGATKDKNAGGFNLSMAQMPIELRGAAVTASEIAKTIHRDVLATLTQMAGNIAVAKVGLDLAKPVELITADLQHQLILSIKDVKGLDMVTVPAQVTPSIRAAITERLTTNAELSIKGVAQDRVERLRKKVEENTLAGGYRTDRLARIVKADLFIGKRRAQFIANQEAGLLVANYRQAKAESLGLDRYEWRTLQDQLVRDDHKDLDGTIHSWNDPPVVNKHTGKKANPGEDYGCRCLALPVVEM